MNCSSCGYRCAQAPEDAKKDFERSFLCVDAPRIASSNSTELPEGADGSSGGGGGVELSSLWLFSRDLTQHEVDAAARVSR